MLVFPSFVFFGGCLFSFIGFGRFIVRWGQKAPPHLTLPFFWWLCVFFVLGFSFVLVFFCFVVLVVLFLVQLSFCCCSFCFMLLSEWLLLLFLYVCFTFFCFCLLFVFVGVFLVLLLFVWLYVCLFVLVCFVFVCCFENTVFPAIPMCFGFMLVQCLFLIPVFGSCVLFLFYLFLDSRCSCVVCVCVLFFVSNHKRRFCFFVCFLFSGSILFVFSLDFCDFLFPIKKHLSNKGKFRQKKNHKVQLVYLCSQIVFLGGLP